MGSTSFKSVSELNTSIVLQLYRRSTLLIMRESTESVRRSRRIPPQLRRLVWENYMPNPREAYGPCLVCTREIHLLDFECGHVKSHADGGTITVDNLRPICSSCNKSMGSKNLFEYKAKYFPNKVEIAADSDEQVDELSRRIERMNLSDSEENQGCVHVLLKGKRKGQNCGREVDPESLYCPPHTKKHAKKNKKK